MASARSLLIGCVFALACAACNRYVTGLPSPHPRPPPAARLRAGFVRIDITPPPGGSLFGYGPEGKVAKGYRQRLHARVMVLEDRTGERIAIVVADLGASSALVHRLVSRQTAVSGIGADRLFIAATHTHAAPTHFFGLAYDLFAGEMNNGGFDGAWTDELANRIATGVNQAALGMRPARAAWTVFPIWGITHNRNMVPFGKNNPRWTSPFTPPSGLSDAQSAIDPAWHALRIDVLDGATYRPAGVWSIFAVHGTAIPSANELYDSDLQGLVSREIERAFATGSELPFVHLFANGSVGDASAVEGRRCPVPTLKRKVEPDLTVIARSSVWLPPPEAAMAGCIETAKLALRDVAARLVPQVEAQLRALVPQDSTLRIARAFETVRARDEPGLCSDPRAGSATLAGVADGVTRYAVAGVTDIEEGGSALDPHGPVRCQRPKRIVAGNLAQKLVLVLSALPRELQFSVIRVGDHVIATIPSEMTTTAGGRIKDTIAVRLAVNRNDVAAMAITNGYLYYLTTAEEYREQHYEGASTLYGPRQAEVNVRVLGRLAAALPTGDQSSPAPLLGRVRAGSVIKRHVFAGANDGPETVVRAVTKITCDGGKFAAEWIDVRPGRLLRAPFPLFQLSGATGAHTITTFDDDLDVEVRALGPTKSGYRWRVDWNARASLQSATLMLTARDSMPTLAQTVQCGFTATE